MGAAPGASSPRGRASRSELARFTKEHFGELVAEIEPQAEKVAAGVDEAMENLGTAFAEWHGVEGNVVALTRHVPSIDGRDVPGLPADVLRSELRRLLAEGTPRPLPRSLYAKDEDDA